MWRRRCGPPAPDVSWWPGRDRGGEAVLQPGGEATSRPAPDWPGAAHGPGALPRHLAALVAGPRAAASRRAASQAAACSSCSGSHSLGPDCKPGLAPGGRTWYLWSLVASAAPPPAGDLAWARLIQALPVWPRVCLRKITSEASQLLREL